MPKIKKPEHFIAVLQDRQNVLKACLTGSYINSILSESFINLDVKDPQIFDYILRIFGESIIQSLAVLEDAFNYYEKQIPKNVYGRYESVIEFIKKNKIQALKSKLEIKIDDTKTYAPLDDEAVLRFIHEVFPDYSGNIISWIKDKVLPLISDIINELEFQKEFGAKKRL